MKHLFLLLCSILLCGCQQQTNYHPISTTVSTSSTTITEVSEPQVPEIQTPTYGEVYAHIICERIELDKDIYYGDDEKLLKKGLGQYEESHLFGEGNVILIAGHNGTHFKAIRNVEVGDTLTVTTNYGTFTYEVQNTEIRYASDFKESELSSDSEKLIMYTCYPFNSLSTDRRFFVYASLIEATYVIE